MNCMRDELIIGMIERRSEGCDLQGAPGCPACRSLEGSVRIDRNSLSPRRGRAPDNSTANHGPSQGELWPGNSMMSPIPVSTIESMVLASWPISWVLFLTAEQVQSIQSFDVTRTDGIVTHSKQFGRLLQLFNTPEQNQLVSLSEVPTQITGNRNPTSKDSVDITNIMRSKTDKSGFIARPDGIFDYTSIESVAVLTLHPPIDKSPGCCCRISDASSIAKLIACDALPWT